MNRKSGLLCSNSPPHTPKNCSSNIKITEARKFKITVRTSEECHRLTLLCLGMGHCLSKGELFLGQLWPELVPKWAVSLQKVARIKDLMEAEFQQAVRTKLNTLYRAAF